MLRGLLIFFLFCGNAAFLLPRVATILQRTASQGPFDETVKRSFSQMSALASKSSGSAGSTKPIKSDVPKSSAALKTGAKLLKIAKPKVSGSAENADKTDDDKRKAAGTGIMAKKQLSQPLAALLGVAEESRAEVTKKIWAYIKEHNLQNPEKKREIICDAALKKLFGMPKLDMLELAKALSPHFVKSKN